MAQEQNLCSNCLYRDSCTYRSCSKRQIYYCEEFQLPPFEKRELLKSAQKHLVENDACVDNSFEFKGLCVNCENRHHCKQSGLEGGVWHCEEYQ